MKKFINIFIVALLLVFAGCNHSAAIQNECSVKFNAEVSDEILQNLFGSETNASVRTATRLFSASDFTELSLSYENSDDATKKGLLTDRYSYANFVSHTFKLMPGKYNFTLTGKIGSYSFEGKITEKTVSGDTDLTFTMNPKGYSKVTKGTETDAVEPKGSVEITATYNKATAGDGTKIDYNFVKKIKVNVYKAGSSSSAVGEFSGEYAPNKIKQADGSEVAESYTCNVTSNSGTQNNITWNFTSTLPFIRFAKEDIDVGSYVYEFIVYATNGSSKADNYMVLSTVKEAAVIDKDGTSKSSITISCLPIYTITYNLGNTSAAWSTGYKAPTKFTSLSDVILPVENDLVLSTKVFMGWYKESTYEGNQILNIKTKDGTLNSRDGSVTLYAKWEDGIAYTVKHKLEKVYPAGEYELPTASKYTQVKYGKAGANTNAVPLTGSDVAGYDVQTFVNREIAQDGTTEIIIYYKRRQVTYTFNLAGGSVSTPFISTTKAGSYTGTATATKITDSTGKTTGWCVKSRYGESCIVNNPTSASGTFKKWQGDTSSDYISKSCEFAFGYTDRTYTALYDTLAANPYSSYTKITVSSSTTSYNIKSIINSNGTDYYWFEATGGKTYTIRWGDSCSKVSSYSDSNQNVDIKVALIQSSTKLNGTLTTLANSWKDSPTLTFTASADCYVKIGVMPWTKGNTGRYVINVTSN